MSDCIVIADKIQEKLRGVDAFRAHIQVLYDNINSGLSESNGVITKEIDSLYKEIDAMYGKKTKLEQEVLVLRRQINIELGIE